MNWVENHIENKIKKRPKKITATRFATVLGLNPWSTPFEVWCNVTHTYEKPFEDTVYTIAGKTIEPKQIAYMRDAYAMNNLRTPTDIYGTDYFSKTYGDFFRDEKVCGGMWDSLLMNEETGLPEAVLEFKTTKRSEDWEDIPEYYALQAALYAYLLGVDDVIMIASFLAPNDYEHPENFVPSAKNTLTREFKVSERYPDFANKVKTVEDWWSRYVETGVSPDFDEKKDAEILKALRTNTAPSEGDIDAVIAEAEQLRIKLDDAKKAVSEDEKRLKTLEDAIKKHMVNLFRDGDKKVVLNGKTMVWEVGKSESKKIDEDALKADGLLEKYKTILTTTYRLTAKLPKAEC